MDRITLTTEQIEKIVGNGYTFRYYKSYFEVLMYSDEMTKRYGLIATDEPPIEKMDKDVHEYKFDVYDKKKWVYTRLKYGI
jgi:hypothetical protein